MKWYIIIVILLLSFISEIWTVSYLQAASIGQAGKAALYSGLLVLIGAFAVLCYVEDPLYLAPDLIGTVVGTYVAVRRSKNFVAPKS